MRAQATDQEASGATAATTAHVASRPVLARHFALPSEIDPELRTDSDLRATQATTDAVLAHARDVVLLFEEDGTIVWASPASKRAFGIDPAALVGQNGMDLIHPADQDRVFYDFTTIPNHGDSVRTEFRVRAGDGSIRWVEEIATNLLDDPHVGSVVGHLRDITERKEAEVELRLQADLLAAAGQAMVARGSDGSILYWNRAAELLFGWDAVDAVGRNVHDLFAPPDSSIGPRGFADLVTSWELPDGRSTWSGELVAATRAGATVPLLVTATVVEDDAGHRSASIFVATDISERYDQRKQAEEDRRRLADAQASAGLGSFEVDLSTGEVTRSEELRRILGRDPGGPEADLFDSLHPDDREDVLAVFASLANGAESAAITHRVLRPDGEIRWVHSKARRSSTAPDRVTGTALDITERHLAELALAHQATHDELTGLANRRLFVERLDASLERNHVTGRRTAVLFIDLDDFKAVNDRIGHAGGDEVLRSMADLIDGVLTPGDTVARLGGDEFVACCEGVTDVADALRVVDRICAALSTPFRAGAETLVVSASIGVVLSQPTSLAESLLRDADAAMYVAKQGGRRVEVFDEAMNERAARRRSLVAELGGAIAEGQIQTWFQPKVDLRSGHLVGFEALARWQHPERGLLGPGDFIELAEDSGLINELGRQVVADACGELARWMTEHPELPLLVSVNLSPIQMASPTLPDDIRSAIAAAGVPASRLCLEVTESSLMDVQLATDVLRSLKEIGVLVAIDDFGTGYSSLSRLKSFPVDFLKIDRSFIAGLGRDAEDELIVAAVIDLSHSLGVCVIAEGIETRQQLAMLRQMGCECGQGYVWSRPMPASEALAYLHAPPSLGGTPGDEAPPPAPRQRRRPRWRTTKPPA